MRHLTFLTMIILMSTIASHAVADSGQRHKPHAVTLWWVIFNNPDACITNPGAAEQCGALDVYGAAFLDSVEAGEPNPATLAPNVDAGLAVLYATGGTTNPKNGKVRLAASIYRTVEHLSMQGEQSIDPLGLGQAFTSTDAEVHIVVRDHGRVKARGVIAQISNFLEPYCSDPLLLFEGGRNRCQDIQAAIFAPEEAGEDTVYSLSSGEDVRGASAYLFRQGDAIQAVIETRIRDRRKKHY